MEFDFFLSAAAAVILGNAVSLAFFFAAVAAFKLQKKDGMKDSELPLWVYPCLFVAPLLMALGVYLTRL